MTNSKKFNFISASALVIATLTGMLFVTPALAATSVAGTNSGANSSRITLIKTRADQEIQRRITALNKLESRIQMMVKVSDTNKASLTGEIQTQITTLTTLQAKIDSDTDLTTLKADQASITKSYRIFILIIPQGAITAAVDRIDTITGLMTTLAGKLQDGITQAQTAGHDTTSLQSLLTDFNAKVADANIQAQAALAEISGLIPDNGNQTTLTANQTALKDARAKIKTATQDLQAARKDAGSIVTGLKGFQPKPKPVAAPISPEPEMPITVPTNQ